VTVVIMAKAPEAGRVKTRLCPPLSPAEAAELSRCFLLDTIERVREDGFWARAPTMWCSGRATTAAIV
jgi:hypothetical protein